MTAGRVLAALRDSVAAEAHVLASDPALLRQQVCNRLDRMVRADADLRPVLEGERTTRREPWLRRVNVPRESDELARTIPAGQEGVVQATLTSTGCCLVTRGRDGTTATWDLGTGARAEVSAASPHHRVGPAEVEEPPILRFAGTSGERLAAVVPRASRRVLVVAPEGPLREVDPAEWGTERFARRVPEAVYLAGHNGDVTCSSLFRTDEGRALLLSGSEDATVRLWEPSTGDELARLSGHTAIVVFVGQASGGTAGSIVSASLDDTIRLWRAPEARRARPGVGHQGAVTSAAMSADSGRAATGGEDGAAIVWDFATETPVWSSAGFRAAVRAVALDAGGTTVAIGLADGIGVLWDVEHDAEVQSGAWSRPFFDGTGFVVDGTAGRMRLVPKHRLLRGTRWVTERAEAPVVNPRRTEARAHDSLLLVVGGRFPCSARVTTVDGDDRLGRYVGGDERGNVYLLQRVDPPDGAPSTAPTGPAAMTAGARAISSSG